MHNVHVVTIYETGYFERKCKKLLSANEHEKLIALLQSNPEAGNLVSGTGGVRKVRLARDGQGKSGGYRILYYFYNLNHPLFLLDIFAKNQQENITETQRNELSIITAELKKAFRL